MTVVGTADILVRPRVAGFDSELKAETAPALRSMEAEAGVAGDTAGANLRGGVRKHSGKLADDLEKDGRRAGAGLAAGVGGGMSKLGGLLANTALPLGALSTGLTKSGHAMAATESQAAGLAGTLDHVGKVALLGTAVAVAGVAAEGIHLATSMQKADASIASAAGTSVASAQKIGDAFLGTAGKSEFSGQEMATAFASVDGQLKTTEGHALSVAEAMKVMEAADDLAVAKQMDLGEATSALSATMQVFHMDAKDAAHGADVLFQTSNATGTGVGALTTQLGRMHSKMGDVAGGLTDMAALLIDMTEHGITGRSAMTGLTSGLNNLNKTSVAVTKASQEQDAALAAMPPSVRKLAEEYRSGSITAKDFTKATSGLPPAQAALASQFATATKALATNKAAYKSLGVEVFDGHGKFVGMKSVIAQLHPEFAKMTQQQQLAAASTLFGAGAARQMTAIVNGGPAAYEKAAHAAGKLGAAHEAAAKQNETLSREEQLVGSAIKDEVTLVGEKLVPVVLTMVKGLVSATKFVIDHKLALAALAVFVGGPLTVAVGVFAVNKMVAFANSFRAAQTAVMGLVGRGPAAIAAVEEVGGASEAAGGQMALFGEGAVAAGTDVETAMAGAETAAVEGAAGIDVAIGSTGVGAILVGVGLAAMLLLTHWKQVWGTIKTVATDAFDWIKSHWQLVAAILIAPVAPAVIAFKLFHKQIIAAVEAALSWVEGAFDDTVAFVGKLPGRIGSAASGMWDGIKDAFRGALDWIIGAWDSLHFSIHVPSVDLGPLGSIGGGTVTIGMPHIPKLAKGGIATKPTLAMVGDAGPEAVVPLDRMASVASASYNPTSWAEAVLSKLGDRITSANVQALVGWEKAEGGHWQNAAKYNPLNTTQTAPGASSINSVGVKAYTSWAEGLNATLATLKNGHYGGILGALQGGSSASAVARAIGASPWGTSAGLVAHTIAGTHVGGIHPTRMSLSGPSASDITAWARKMVGHFAESWGANQGPELNKLQKQFGTNAAAWCAEFATTAATMGGAHKAVRTASVAVIRADAQAGKSGYRKGVFHDPHVGDLMMFGNQHVGFVEKVNRKSGTVTTIEGNTNAGNGAVRRVTHRIGSGDYARPIYPAGASAGAGLASPTAMQNVTVEIAKQRATLNKTIAGEQAAFKAKSALEIAEVKKGTAAQKAAVQQQVTQQRNALQQEIVGQRSGLAIRIANERNAAGLLTKQQAAELRKQTADEKSGVSIRNSLLTAIHKGSLSALNTALFNAHLKGLASIEKRLSHDHSSALAALSKQLVKVHAAAVAKQTQQQKAADDAADAQRTADADKAQAAAIQGVAQIATDQATAQVKSIQDASKVKLDQMAEQGQTGADLLAAQAQTALDQLVQQDDQAIAAAQLNVDQSAGGTETQKAQAAADLAAAQANSQVAEAQQQAAVDMAKATASAADAAANSATTTDTPASTSTSIAPSFQFTINGGGMTAADLMSEVGWLLKTGQLPTAAPMAVPAPALTGAGAPTTN